MRGDGIDTAPTVAAPLRSYLAWLRASGASAATRRAYEGDLRQLSSWLDAAGVPPEHATTQLLRRYAAYLGTMRYAPATASRKLSAVRGAYAWMLERGLIDRDPAALLPGPRRPKTLPATLSPAEIGTVLDPGPHAEERETPRSLRDRALIELIYACGLRAAEACV